MMILKSTLAVAGVFVCLCVASGHAAEAPSEMGPELSLESILSLKLEVASLLEQTDLEAPSAVSVVDYRNWKLLGARHTLDPLEDVPGVMVYPQSVGSAMIAIRGYSSSLSTRGVAGLLDGIRVNNYSYGTSFFGPANIGPGALDRVEMIRGPGSTVYGSDAFHGVISMKTWSPTENAIETQAAYGSFGQYRVGVNYSKQFFVPDLRFTAIYSMNGVDDENIDYSYRSTNIFTFPPQAVSKTIHESRAFDSKTFVAKLSHKKTEAAFYVVDQTAEGHRPGSIVLLGLGLEQKRQSRFYLTKVSHRQKLTEGLELDGRLYYGFFRDRNVNYGDRDTNLQQTSEYRTGLDLFLKHSRNVDYPVEWVAGLTIDYFKNKEAYTEITSPSVFLPSNYSFLPPPVKAMYAPYAAGRSIFPSEKALSKIHALFAQTDTSFFERRFHVIAGVRGDHYSDFGWRASERAGLIFLPWTNTSFKLLYGNSFRAPTPMERYGTGTTVAPNAEIKPETINTYELQMVHRANESAFTLGVFRSVWDNAILAVQLPSNTGQYQNRGTSRAYGLETELRTNLKPVELWTSGSYVRSADYRDSSRIDYSGFPILILNWGVDTRVGQIKTDFSLKNHHRFYQTAGVTPSSGKAPTYFRTDLTASWDAGNTFGTKPDAYRLDVFVQNLFNRKNFQAQLFGTPEAFEESGTSIVLGVSARL